MRITASFLTLLFLIACGGGEDAAPADEPMEEAAAPAEAAPTVADFAGTWQGQAMLEGTAEPVPYTLAGSASASDWTMTLEGRDPIPLTVSMSGDSLVTRTAPYESVLREGVMVTVRTAGVLQDGRMVGRLVATYAMPDGEEVVTGTTQATREEM